MARVVLLVCRCFFRKSLRTRVQLSRLIVSIALPLLATASFAQTPSPALLILEKDDSMLAVIDPVSLKVVGRVAAGVDPHEVAASSDGKTAYITNYGADRKSTRLNSSHVKIS